MKVSGFTFIRNALHYDYPIVESIKSVLTLCDEFVVAVGQSDDNTLALIKEIDKKKIKIIETIWDDTLRKGGHVLAVETNKAFAAINKTADWGFYIQGDEVIHEKYLKNIYDAMARYKDVAEVDGLLFNYSHFYGSYDYLGTSSRWYDKEIRVVKNRESIYSYKDAQGFRKENNKKLRVCPIDAYVFHYGYVRSPKAMQRKQAHFPKYWHDDKWLQKNVNVADSFDYNQPSIKGLRRFSGTHPRVMQERITRKNWLFKHDTSFGKPSRKDQLKRFLKKRFNIDLNYKNYKLAHNCCSKTSN